MKSVYLHLLIICGVTMTAIPAARGDFNGWICALTASTQNFYAADSDRMRAENEVKAKCQAGESQVDPSACLVPLCKQEKPALPSLLSLLARDHSRGKYYECMAYGFPNAACSGGCPAERFYGTGSSQSEASADAMESCRSDKNVHGCQIGSCTLEDPNPPAPPAPNPEC